MRYFVVLDSEGRPKSFYTEDSESIPKEAIEIDEKTYAALLSSRFKLINGKLVEEEATVSPEKVLLSLRRTRIQKVLTALEYDDLGDVKVYADMGDKEARQVLDWYLLYDDLIYQALQNITNKDLIKTEKEIFLKSIEKFPVIKEVANVLQND